MQPLRCVFICKNAISIKELSRPENNDTPIFLCLFRRIWLSLSQKEKMAKPIAPTPPLKGKDAVEFIRELERNKKVSSEEKERKKAISSNIYS